MAGDSGGFLGAAPQGVAPEETVLLPGAPGTTSPEAKKYPQNGKGGLQLDSPRSLRLPVAPLQPQETTTPSGASGGSAHLYTLDSPASLHTPEQQHRRDSIIQRMMLTHSPPHWLRWNATARSTFLSHLLILAGLVACDILHSVDNGHGAATLALPLAVLYVVLAVLLLSSAFFARRLTCRCPLWPGIGTMQLAIIFLSSAWRQDLQPDAWDQGDRFSALGALMQVLLVFLYPAGRVAVALHSLSTMALLVVLQLMHQSDLGTLVGNFIVLACVGMACVLMGFRDCEPAAEGVPPLVRSDMAARFAQFAFDPILSGDTQTQGPNIETKLQRIVKRLVETKIRIERCDSLDFELSEVLRNVVETMLEQMDSSNIFRIALSDANGATTAINAFLKETFDPHATPADWINKPDKNQSPRAHDAADVPSMVNMVAEKIPILAEAVRITPVGSRTLSKSVPMVEDQEMVKFHREKDGEVVEPDEHDGQDVQQKDYNRAVTYMVGCLRYCEKPQTILAPMDELATLRLDRLAKWDFDIPEFATKCENMPLVLVGIAGSGYYVRELRLNSKRVGDFFRNVAFRYHTSNPYHNCMHGADVLNDMLYFLNLKQATIQKVSNLEKFAALIACAAHDVGHNGKANRYHMMVASPLSLLYNDKSCLENMSCSMLFAILQMEACNFLVDFDTASKATLRSFVVAMILETDLAQHMQVVADFRQKLLPADADKEKGPVDFESLSPQDRKQFLAFILKFCDVGHSSKPFALHTKWSLRITHEFFAQGDAERAQSMPCSPFCDRRGTNICESQKGFFDFIVVPLFSALDEFLVCSQLRMEVFADLHRNQKFWKNFTGDDFNYEDALSNYALLQISFVDICRSLYGRRNSSYGSLGRLLEDATGSSSSRGGYSSALRSGASSSNKHGIQPMPPKMRRPSIHC